MRGIASGIVGGLLIDLFIYFTSLAPHHAGILGLWQFIASSAFGTVAYTSTGYAWAGLAMHALVSMAWGVGYSYLSQTQQAVNKMPIISGLVFGLIVYVVMQIGARDRRAAQDHQRCASHAGDRCTHGLFRASGRFGQ